MNNNAAIIGIAALIAIGAGWAATRQNSNRESDSTSNPDAPIDNPNSDFWMHPINSPDSNQASTPIMASINIEAFLDMISVAEGTERAPDPYRVCYGYKHTIKSFADHPAVTKEWTGEPLSAGMCISAGNLPGCVSTAAGRYQFIKPTWLGLREKLKLPDFSPDSQDAAAEELLRQCGALPLIKAGDIEGAIAKSRKIWASFPSAGYGQGERTVAWMVDQFQQAGGTTA
jgi:muramidase (phage lysozyme)